MAKTVENFGRSSELVGRVVRKLENDGLESGAVFHVLDNDKTARTQLVQFANRFAGSSGTTPSFQRARDILGDDFISPQEVAEALGVSYTEAQLASLAATLPAKEVLQWARDNGFAVVTGPPKEMNLLHVRDLAPELFYSRFGGWYAKTHEEFARKDVVGTTWLVVRKDPVPNSTLKTWNEQQALLSGNERVPNVAEAVWFFTTYAKVRGIRLVPSVYVRTSSVYSDGHHVYVGDFGGRGLYVVNERDDRRYDNVGVASARK